MRWTEPQTSGRMRVSQVDALRVAKELHLTDCESLMKTQTHLVWVDNEQESGQADLAWRLDTEKGRFFISADDGQLLHSDYYLIEYEAQSTENDYTDPTHQGPAYDCAEYVYNIMDENFDTSNLRDNPSKSEWISASSSYAFFSVGHGYHDATKNWVTLDESPTVRVYPSDINDVPSRYLVYILHCFSGYIASTQANSLGYQFVWNSRRYTLEEFTIYDNAFVGFDSNVTQSTGCEFTKMFWDRLDDGYSVASARSYAGGSYPGTEDHCVIYGDSSTTLDG